MRGNGAAKCFGRSDGCRGGVAKCSQEDQGENGWAGARHESDDITVDSARW